MALDLDPARNPQPTAVTIKFHIRASEFVAAYLLHLWRHIGRQVLGWFVFLVILVFLLVPGVRFTPLPIAAWVLAGVVVSALAIVAKAYLAYHADPSRGAERTVTASPAGLDISWMGVVGTIPWGRIGAIWATKNAYLLFLSRTDYLLIPRRAFPTPEAEQTFCALATGNTAPAE